MSLRVLFVDDEPNILEALQRMLRPLRAEWEMRFALGGAAALARLAEGPADVLVTDWTGLSKQTSPS
jgi:CheY-like chemotaxis protein